MTTPRPDRRTAGVPPDGLTVLPITGIREIQLGDDLAAVIVAAAPWLTDGDVLVVTSKIVSKAEGALVPVPEDGPARQAARQSVLAGQTARTVASRGDTRIVQTHHGFVMASAGIDASNIDRGHLVLLPADPDASARTLRARLRDRHGLDLAVIISDTMGRPWRVGLTDVALGAAGINALRDYRGQSDAHGNALHITQMAIIDELASAAELVKGKYDQVPVAVIRGLSARDLASGGGLASGGDLPVDGDLASGGPLARDTPISQAPARQAPARQAPWDSGAAVLVRDPEHDLFSLGTAEARATGMRAAAVPPQVERFADLPVDLADLNRALALIGSPALRLLDDDERATLLHTHPHLAPAAALVAAFVLGDARLPTGLAAAARAGADLARLGAALLAAGLVSQWLPDPPAEPGAPVAVLAIGYP